MESDRLLRRNVLQRTRPSFDIYVVENNSQKMTPKYDVGSEHRQEPVEVPSKTINSSDSSEEIEDDEEIFLDDEDSNVLLESLFDTQMCRARELCSS